MDEFSNFCQLRQTSHAILQEVLDGLHVVIGGALGMLDPEGVGFGKVRHQRIQKCIGFGREGRYFRNAGMGRQTLQPAYFHFDTGMDQAVFAEIGA